MYVTVLISLLGARTFLLLVASGGSGIFFSWGGTALFASGFCDVLFVFGFLCL